MLYLIVLSLLPLLILSFLLGYKHALLLTSIGIIAYYTNKAYNKKNQQTANSDYISQPITPQNTIITFDLHGVLFQTNYPKIFKIFLRSPHKYRIMLHMLNPKLLFDILRLRLKEAVAEEYVVYLINKYPYLMRYKSLIIKIGNAQKPITETIDIIKQLKSQGYTLHILSNIGEYFFADLKRDFPDIFALFDDIKITTAAENYIGKPYPQIFKYYLKEYNGNNKQIIFIDDKQKNVTAATSLGMIGIRYTSPQQLYSELTTLHVL